MDLLEHVVRIKVFAALEAVHHLRDPLRPEGLLGIDHDDRAVEPALIGGKLTFTASW